MIQQERNKHHLMNSKSEYNRCALPRLTSKLGEVELGKWREKDMEEMKHEASIEEKIRSRKKKKSLERAERARRMDKDQPKKKRRKVDKEDKDSMATVKGVDEIQEEDREVRERKTTTPRKRQELNERSPNKPRKRRKIHTSIRDYITCKRWKAEEEEKMTASQEEVTERPEDPMQQQQQEDVPAPAQPDQPISPPQECSEAFARIGLVACLVSPKKLKTGESHQPGPAVEPLLVG